MPDATQDLVGKTFGETILVVDSIGSHGDLHWFSGTHKIEKLNLWLAIPISKSASAPSNYKAIKDKGLPLGVLWYHVVPEGQLLTTSLGDGPLAPRQVLTISLQCLYLTEQPISSSDVWWDESNGRVTWVGESHLSETGPRPSPLKAIGYLLWHMATGTPYAAPVSQIASLLPEPFPSDLASVITELISNGKSRTVKDYRTLVSRLESISADLDSGVTDETAHTQRQTTQEIWQGQNSQYVGRAAGQPVFLIVGGLITAAVISLLGSLGFFAPEDVGRDEENKVTTQQNPEQNKQNHE